MPHKRKELKIEGPNLWYLVGLITSDGCLSSDKRHIDVTSKDRNFLKKVKCATGLKNKVTSKYNSNKQESFHIQIANKNFYDFLLSIGLTPKKSLTLAELKIPDSYFIDFLRGVIDGDGCIRRWLNVSNKKEQWSLRVYSGSSAFICWMKGAIEKLLKAKGRIYKGTNSLWILKYGKMAAREITKNCYYENCLSLSRKDRLARECFTSTSGWSKSKTILN